MRDLTPIIRSKLKLLSQMLNKTRVKHFSLCTGGLRPSDQSRISERSAAFKAPVKHVSHEAAIDIGADGFPLMCVQLATRRNELASRHDPDR
ncbi:protein of unknown function [Methylocaldum szegediense]|uniref:Uncharacterized protein n=1 Tax=Methylocaldum szegediense TaxID=73780 RepID=A0ABM9HWZ4_9GAMM|nr:protein of unknown function [Methylocaldum szegediense]